MSDPRARAWAAAAAVTDPEISVLTIEDLGVLRDIRIDGDIAEAVITPTYSGCPAMGVIAFEVAAALRAAGFSPRVTTVLAPAWTTDWMSAAGRAKLRDYGIAPPTRGPVACPLCRSADTEKLSEFGSTACKALWRCRACCEPFDLFKCH